MTKEFQDLVLQVPTKRIRIFTDEAGHPLNPRGPVRDTTDLQATIRGDGRIIVPLVCVRQEDEIDGETIEQLYLINGHRRLSAARALKLDKVPVTVIELRPGEDPVDLMLRTNVAKAFPAVVLDKEGAIIGGVAKAVAHKIDTSNKTLEALADIMGMRPDLVSAYHRLYYAPVEVRRAVAAGRLSMTGFARMKYASSETQREIVDSTDGNVSVTRVRGALAREKAKTQQRPLIPDELTEAATVTEETETEHGTETAENAPADRLAALNRILRGLKRVDPATLDGRERFVWDQIVDHMLSTVEV